jgi:hypothetical protein
MEEFDSLESGNFRITLSGSASAVSSDGYLVFTTVNGEMGQAIAEYAELVDTSENIRYSLLFNYVTTNTSQFRVFDIGKGKFYLFLNKTNKLRIVVLNTEGAVRYIGQSGAVVDSAYDFNISVNTEYILEVIIADGKIKAKTLGKMLDQQLTVEGLFSIVLMAQTDGKRHYFITQSDGTNPCKSPMEMFDSVEIDNDLKMVDDTIREYYGLDKNVTKKKTTTKTN